MMNGDETHPPTRLLVLRERDFMLRSAHEVLSAEELREVTAEIEAALAFPDDEATLVLATIKTAWQL